MAGWWVPLMLVLAPWLPGVQPCLLCFVPPSQQERLCRDITGAPVSDPQHQYCLEALVQAAVPLVSVTVGSGQHEALREIVVGALHFLEQQKGLKPLEVSLQKAVNRIWVKLSQLEEAPACIPPCGHQPAARVFQCATCRVMDCQYPLDCPVQDLWVREGEAITLHCDVPFASPRHPPVAWMMAKDLRTQDLSLFKELPGSAEGALGLTLQEPTAGTIACRLGDLSEPLVRKYFYLNVSKASVEAEKGLQARFRAVLLWPPSTTARHPTVLLGLGLALGVVVLVLLLVASWHCWRLAGPRDTGTPGRAGQQGPPGDSGSPDSP